MRIEGKEYRTIWFENNVVKIIDQTKLPHQFIIKDLKTIADAINAIKKMEVRGAPLIGATAAYGLVLAIIENNDLVVQLKELNNKWLWWLLYRFLYKKADKVICQSNFMLNELSEKFSIPKERMVFLYNPINISEIRGQADADLNPFIDSGNGPNIIGVGRLVHQKGYEKILNFIPKILEKYPDVKFWILGVGELELKLKELINNLDISNHVYFVGNQKNPYVWMKHADLFVLSSNYEGLPNALLEAITNGCPILSLKHPGGTKEILDLFSCSNRFISSFSLDNFFDKDVQFSDEILTEYFSDKVIIKKYEQEFIKILG